MNSRALVVVLGIGLSVGSASGEVKPTVVDIKPFRSELRVFRDGDGGSYFLRSATDKEARRVVFYASPGRREAYEQYGVSSSRDGKWWSLTMWAPRLQASGGGEAYAELRFRDDQFALYCLGERPLTELTGDKAKTAIDSVVFMTPFMTRKAHLLARDDHAVYYYVDKYTDRYGKGGYRVWVGRRGAMKLQPLEEVAVDSEGEVFATKSGSLRLSRRANVPPDEAVKWIRGTKESALVGVGTYVNNQLIYSDLGVYTFIGTVCDKVD